LQGAKSDNEMGCVRSLFYYGVGVGNFSAGVARRAGIDPGGIRYAVQIGEIIAFANDRWFSQYAT